MKVLGIDPGPKQSAYIVWDGELEQIDKAQIIPNEALIDAIRKTGLWADVCIIEQIKSYGMAVSDSIFDTVYWTGRFCEAWGNKGFFDRMPRMTVKMHLCHNSRAKDSNIRQALIDRFGEPGTKKNQGLTYGLKADLWAAFGIAVVFYDLNCENLKNDTGE